MIRSFDDKPLGPRNHKFTFRAYPELMLQRFFSVFSILVLAGQLAIWGQSEAGTGTINGTVTDPSGAVVAGANVTATNKATGLTREVKTSDGGVFTFVRLPVGMYDLKFDFQGFKTLTRPDLPLTVGAVATVDITLQVGATGESVTVTEEVPVIETTRSQVSTLVSEKLVRDLPINGRNFLDFTILTPGVVRDPRGGDLSFGGQRGTVNSFLVDGTDSNNTFFGQSTGRQGVRNPYAVSQDSVQEFQVNTNGYAPELGRASGGVVNVITKSGTNQLHGGAFFFYRDTSLNANNAINKSQGRPRGPYKFRQFGANLGGPIVANRLFFFVNYDGQRNNEPIVMTTNARRPTDPVQGAEYDRLVGLYRNYDRGLDNDVLLTKFDWNIASGKTLNFRWNGNRFTGRNFENSGAQRLSEATGDSLVNTDTLGATYTQVINSRDVLDLRYVYVRDDQPGEANSNNPETTIREGGQTIIVTGRNNFSPRYTNLSRNQIVSTLTAVRGKHTIKFGGDLNFERIKNFFPGQFAGVYTFNSIADWLARRPAQFAQGIAGPNTAGALTQPNINELAFFIQDTWRLTDRLTLNYGLRYDVQDTADPPVANSDAQLVASGYRTDFMPLDKNNWAPRFGFAYRVTKDDRMVVRGGYGIFYGRTPAILTGTVHSQNGTQVQNYTFNAPNIPVTYPNVLTAPPTVSRTPNIFVFEKDYQQPASQQWNLQVETRLLKDVSVTVGYLGVRGYNLTRSRDINFFPYQSFTGTIAGGGNFTYFRRPATRPFTNFGRITLVESGADSFYHAGFVQVTKRFSRNWQIQASYTYSNVIDTAPEATAVLPANAGDDSKIAQDTLNPNNDRARGDADVPHRLVWASVYDFTMFNNKGWLLRSLLGDWQYSSIWQVQSGRVFNARVNIDLNNDGNLQSDRVPGVGRNTLRLPTFMQTDVRLTKTILPATERVRIKLIGEAFNLWNRVNITGRNANQFTITGAPTAYVFTANPQFRAETAAADPRIVQLALKIEF